MIKKLDEPLYLYENHLGGLYTTTDLLDFDSLYCEQCGDSDSCLGSFSTLAEFWKLISENECIFDLQYIYPLAVRYFCLPYTVTYKDKNEKHYGVCCNSNEEIISNINKSIKECKNE